ncbi:cupin domain-containing protein [Solwaraspora sp. WMMD791]|uniref:cupin domain-containing protein n=1 Tax=Solwaraspora sp. WMMD791 TaxID=3016086 RepID=UPI00249B95F9|nr:cupin domain-containing protein [Solwaraspora sp. WMMD791]WFE27844.1 cupin domain-containing protein [Solwaraspora sp. WMMD791]
MYHVTRMDDERAVTPPDYAEHSTGFRRQDLIGRETGSHHMTMSTGILDPGGAIAVTVHSYEKSLWIWSGELTLTMLGQRLTLRADDCALVPVAVAHQLTAGSAGARWLETSAPVRLLPGDHRRDTFFVPGELTGGGDLGGVDLRDPRNRHFFRFDSDSMDLRRLARGSDPNAPEVSASMATALLAYSGIGIRMLADQRVGAQLHTMFMVEYQPTAVAHPHDHPFEEAYVFTEGRTEAVVAGGVELSLEPGDVLWTGSGCDHAFYNRTDGRTRWIETQSPQPPAQHSYRFNRDWEYLDQKLCAGVRVDPRSAEAGPDDIGTAPR